MMPMCWSACCAPTPTSCGWPPPAARGAQAVKVVAHAQDHDLGTGLAGRPTASPAAGLLPGGAGGLRSVGHGPSRRAGMAVVFAIGYAWRAGDHVELDKTRWGQLRIE